MDMGNYSSLEEQAKYLTNNPHRIGQDWVNGRAMFACLPNSCTCLTMIKTNIEDYYIAKEIIGKELADQIRNDPNIPDRDRDENIEPKHFPTFIKYQKIINNIK